MPATTEPPEYARHTVDAFLVQKQLLGALHLGYAPELLLRRAGIAPELLHTQHARVTQAQCAALLRVLRRVLRDEFWGLLDRPLRPGTYALACQAMVRAATLGDAFTAGLAELRPHIDDFVARLQVRGEVASLRLFARAPRTPRLDYARAAFLFRAFGLASWLVGRRLPLLAVDLETAPPDRKLDTERMFAATTRHHQPHTAMHFDAGALRLPVVQDETTLAALLRERTDRLLLRFHEDGSLQEDIRRRLRERLRHGEPGDWPSLEDVAASLGLTAPTLRRRLWEEDASYSAIRDGLRRDAAIAALERGELSLQDLAQRLGFSEASAFHRAFKKWTGVPPGEYRQRLQSG